MWNPPPPSHFTHPLPSHPSPKLQTGNSRRRAIFSKLQWAGRSEQIYWPPMDELWAPVETKWAGWARKQDGWARWVSEAGERSGWVGEVGERAGSWYNLVCARRQTNEAIITHLKAPATEYPSRRDRSFFNAHSGDYWRKEKSLARVGIVS